ncbi:hypothetical protein Agub_g15948, partial [Astrephomene gubernaculifera]
LELLLAPLGAAGGRPPTSSSSSSSSPSPSFPSSSSGGGPGRSSPPPPLRPHPRVSPELLLRALLAALRRGQLAGAARLQLTASGGSWEWQLSASAALLNTPGCQGLMRAGGARLGPSALVDPQQSFVPGFEPGSGAAVPSLRMLQEVTLLDALGEPFEWSEEEEEEERGGGEVVGSGLSEQQGKRG